MSVFLFDKIIFGPVKSRRLGQSLGVNLLPLNRKVCNFNCLYCECGLNGELGEGPGRLPKREEIRSLLEQFLREAPGKNISVDTITFAGNGEPTLHPKFPEIIEDTVTLRDQLLPGAKIAVLSNATTLAKESVRKALKHVDLNILKLDSGLSSTIELINCPVNDFGLQELLNNLKSIDRGLIIQTLFIRGSFKGKYFDNTSHEELQAWMQLLKELQPDSVMIYSIARDTPVDTLEKVSHAELEQIAGKVKQLGIDVIVS